MQKQQRYFLLSIFAIALMLIVQYVLPSGRIARAHLVAYRKEFLVKLGTTTDESMFLISSTPIHLTTAEKKISNRNRTFRAYFIKDAGGVSRVALESAKPHRFFQLSGSYAVSPETAEMIWIGNSILSFDGVDREGRPTRFELRVNDLMLRETALTHLSNQHSMPLIDGY